MENNERPTKELKLDNGAVLSLYEYITGRDKRAIEAVYLEQAQIKQSAKGGVGGDRENTMELSGMTGAVQHAMQDKALSCVVKSIVPAEGAEAITDRAKVLGYILDLPEADFDKVVRAVNAITDPKAQATS